MAREAQSAAAIARSSELALAALPLIEETADKRMESLVNDLQQYTVGQV